MWTYIIPRVCSILVAWVEAQANADSPIRNILTDARRSEETRHAMQEADEAQGKYQAFIVATAVKQCAKA